MNLESMFAVLKPDLSVEPVPVTPNIYDELNAKFDQFRGHVLITCHEFESDWNIWEMHPAGDEVVVLLSGSARLALRKSGDEEFVELTDPGAYVVVPRGTWHTAYVSTKTRMLFITPGAGTEHRAEV